MSFSPLIDQLIESFRCLPGIGPKSAQRMALHILERDRLGGEQLANTLLQAVKEVKKCNQCRIHCETDICKICASLSRDPTKLCIVESPADVLVIEQTGLYRGRYFVLMGHLSPIDGIGPSDIGIDHLLERASEGEINEIIMATNATVEGEATSHYIAEHVKHLAIEITRIAHGVPLGGELEYVDGSTLAHAFAGRHAL